MRIFGYRINSSVVIASLVALLASATDLLSNGGVVDTITTVILYFLDKPETFKPYIADKVYQFLLTFLPVVIIILRNTNVRYKPPIERVNDDKE